MLTPDHFFINVAVCTRIVGDRREYQHKFRVELPSTRTKQEARETFYELRGIYPYPEFIVSLTSAVCRGTTLETTEPPPPSHFSWP